ARSLRAASRAARETCRRAPHRTPRRRQAAPASPGRPSTARDGARSMTQGNAEGRAMTNYAAGLLFCRTVQRPLCDMERAFFLLDRGHPFNGVYVVSLCGPLTEALLRAGLARIEARHPVMRARIVPHVAGDE